MKNLNGLRNYPMKTIRSMIRSFFVCAAAVFCLMSFADPASALTLIVNDLTSDSSDSDGINGICQTSGGTCTLRAAMQEINGTFGGANNTIAFSLSLGAHTLFLTSNLPTMIKSVTISGPGSDYAIVDGQGLYRIFSFQSPATSVFVENLTLRNGSAGGSGGAISVTNGVTVSISKVVFQGNMASQSGGAVYCEGCVAYINRCRFSGNQASVRGGAIGVFSGGYVSNMHDTLFESNTAGNYGGAIHSAGSDIDMGNVVFEGNSAGTTGGALDIAVHDGHFLKIANSSFKGNTVVQYGGAVNIFGDGRAVFDGVTFSGNSSANHGGAARIGSPAGYTTMANCTITGNDAGGLGGGIHQSDGTVQLANVTVTENSAGSGGGLQGTFSVRNSVIAGNVDFNQPAAPDCQGTINSDGYNLIGDSSDCSVTGGPGDQVGTALSPIDPVLGPLAWNGGSTPTHALLSASPALDLGNPGGCYWDHDADAASPEMLLSVDQRTVARPFDGDGNGSAYCDAGAYERTNCDNGIQDNGESGIDCGGGGCVACNCSISKIIAKIIDAGYSLIQAAYNNEAWDSALIKALETDTIEELTFDRAIYSTLRGGYDCDFFRIRGMTTVASLTVSAGRLTVENIIIGP